MEEKVDGANLGISIDDNYSFRFQNRAHFVSSASHAQFRQLDAWAAAHTADLLHVLTSPALVLFGEWCYARHSLHYTDLPDLLLVFDIYDRTTDTFYSRERREAALVCDG